MEKSDSVPNTLVGINIGTVVQTEWTTFLKKIKLLDQGSLGTVYLAEDSSTGKQYIVKECMTLGKTENIKRLLLREPAKLEKIRKYNHPNL